MQHLLTIMSLLNLGPISRESEAQFKLPLSSSEQSLNRDKYLHWPVPAIK